MAHVNVIVVGCGRVGRELAMVLDRDGHSVSVMDKDRNAFHELPDGFTGKAILGFGFDREHLEQAGIREAQAVAAVTNGDNSNILTARIARMTYEVPHVVARIYDPRRAVVYQRLGIPTVATVTWTTDQVVRRLFSDQTSVEWSDASGSVRLVERALPEGWAGHKLAGLSEGDQFRVTSISRGGQSRIVAGDLVGQEGDILHILARTDALDALEARLAGGAEGGH